MDIQDVLGDFFDNYDKLEKLSECKHTELSNVDIELSNFYHTIEEIHLSHNTQGHNLILELQDILRRRRQLKRETILIRSFIDNTQQAIKTAKSRGIKILDKHTKLMNNLKNSSRKFEKN